jgi:hypothetical protein
MGYECERAVKWAAWAFVVTVIGQGIGAAAGALFWAVMVFS